MYGEVFTIGANRAIVGNWNETNGLNVNFNHPDNVNPNLRLAPLIVSYFEGFAGRAAIHLAFYLFLEGVLVALDTFYRLGSEYLYLVLKEFLKGLVLY